MWDDHEVENDYAGLDGQAAPEVFRQQRAAAYRAYWEHQPLPRALRPNEHTMRIVGAHDWGRLARVLCIDTRQHRDLQACRTATGMGVGVGAPSVRRRDCATLADPRRSLLGAAQETWLAEAWSAEHGWNLLAQQTLMAATAGPGEVVWTDGWDGYAPARSRLLQTVADRRVPNPVVLGGDVHATYVADLRVDAGNLNAPVVATEFCGTSITSHGWTQARTDALLARTPHLRYGRSDRRGSLIGQLDARSLRLAVRSVDRPEDPDSPARTTASFVVEAGRAGAQAA